MREAERAIETSDGIMDTFICHPEEDGPFPAVVLYMDAPGIREELRDMARRLGTVGYYVLLPNLFYRSGREGSYGFDPSLIRFNNAELEKMYAVMRALTNEQVVADTQSILDLVRIETLASAGPLGCVGYCMSGQFVMSVSAAYPEAFAAVASYYGVGLITDKEDSPHLGVSNIRGEVYLAFGAEDPHVPQSVVESLPAIMSAAGVNHRIEVYPGTLHGFAFPQRQAYDKEAAERHWERMFALFDRCLRGRRTAQH